MTTIFLKNKKIEQSFNEIISWLSDKEQSIIERRIWLAWDKETLQSIWKSFIPPITRERVRQIEETGINKLWRLIKTKLFLDIQAKSKDLLELHGGLLLKNKLINVIIKEFSLEHNVNASIIDIIIQTNNDIKKSKPRLNAKTYYFLGNISKPLIDGIYKESLRILRRKKNIMNQEKLYSLIQENLKSTFWYISIPLIDWALDIFDWLVKWEETLIGLSRWKILNPKTLKDKAIYIMKKEKVPMHFVDLSNSITKFLGESVKVNTIHNELIRNKEFVLIGRWIYALKEWWFIPGTVIDVIINVLEKNKWPMTTDEITDKVLETRNVKKTTIYMNLQNKNIIERVWRNYYQVKK